MSQERRRHPRILESLAVQYQADFNTMSRWHRATVMNISAGGLRFRCADEPPDERARVSLQVPMPDMERPALLRGQVLWREMQASGVTDVGAELISLGFERRRLIERLISLLRASASSPPGAVGGAHGTREPKV